MNPNDERRLADYLKATDDVLKLLRRLREPFSTLVRESPIDGMIASLQRRREQSFYIVAIELPDPAAYPPAPQPFHRCTPATARLLRPGVHAIPMAEAGEAIGAVRMFADVVVAGSGAPAELTGASSRFAAPLQIDALPDPGMNRLLGAFGAAREAWHVLDQVDRLIAAESLALDQTIAAIDAGVGARATPERGNTEALMRLDALLTAQITVEREAARDRESGARRFFLASQQLAAGLDMESIEEEIRGSAVDRVRPGMLRTLFGKTIVDVRLRDAVINDLVARIDTVAIGAAEDRVRRLHRKVEREVPGGIERLFGWNPYKMDAGPGTETNQLQAQATQESIAGAGRNFRFKFDRPSVIGRIMRARMEIAGLMMLVFLYYSASGLRRPVVEFAKITLLIVGALAIISYVTSFYGERDRREEELEKLREQMVRVGAEAAARRYFGILGQMVEELERFRAELRARIESIAPSRTMRTIPTAPALRARCVSLRGDLAKEVAGTSGTQALRHQLTQLIGRGGASQIGLLQSLKAPAA